MKNVCELTVDSCTPANDEGTFWVKMIQRKKGVNHPILGEIGASRRTYYAASTKEVEEGTELSLDLSQFDIVDKPFTYYEEDGSPKEIKLSVLRVKGQNPPRNTFRKPKSVSEEDKPMS